MCIAFVLGLAMLFLLALAVQPVYPQSKDAIEKQLDSLFLQLTAPEDPWEGHTRMCPTVETRGFRTVIECFTRDGLTIVTLCNRLDLEPEARVEKSAAPVLRNTNK